MLKAYKYRLKPTKKQETLINKHIGSCRLVYNWALEQKIKTYEQTGKSINHMGLDKLLPALKTEKPFLRETLAQAISDSAWHSFVTKLEYKAEWLGKTVLRIGQFEPSSKLCNACGYHNSGLTLKDREWVCPDCKTPHDRDINAAINIKKFSLLDQNLITT